MRSDGVPLDALLECILALGVERGLRDALLGEAVRAAATSAVQPVPRAAVCALDEKPIEAAKGEAAEDGYHDFFEDVVNAA
eukprot:626854-Alexandrium_andersonii.AAC.1